MVGRILPIGLFATGWALTSGGHLRRVLFLLRSGWDTPWPALLEHPALVVVAYVVGLAGILGGLLPRARRPAAVAWLGATIVLALHRITAGDAAYYAGIWVAAWWTWLVWTESTHPDRARVLGPRLATWVAAALFVGPGVGKLMPAFTSGEALLPMMGEPLLMQWTGLPAESYARRLGQVSALGELSALAWLVLPVRWGLPIIGITVIGMMLAWNVWLAAILFPVMGMAVAAWDLHHRP